MYVYTHTHTHIYTHTHTRIYVYSHYRDVRYLAISKVYLCNFRNFVDNTLYLCKDLLDLLYKHKKTNKLMIYFLIIKVFILKYKKIYLTFKIQENVTLNFRA